MLFFLLGYDMLKLLEVFCCLSSTEMLLHFVTLNGKTTSKMVWLAID